MPTPTSCQITSIGEVELRMQGIDTATGDLKSCRNLTYGSSPADASDQVRAALGADKVRGVQWMIRVPNLSKPLEQAPNQMHQSRNL